MPRKLPLVCPSNEEGVGKFYTEPCRQKACSWWGPTSSGTHGCTAGEEASDAYRRWFKEGEGPHALPACPSADACTWNVDAVRRGEPGCGPRRLGLVCEHQGEGDVYVWNTFEMAEPDDEEAWGSSPSEK